jgi:hypothetical protein
MNGNRKLGAHDSQQPDAGSHSTFQQIAAQLNPLSPAALRRNGGGYRVDTNLNQYRFRHGHDSRQFQQPDLSARL